jgi:hypothetical protein
MGYSNINIYVIVGIVIFGLVWGVYEWRKSVKKNKVVPVDIPVIKKEIKEMPIDTTDSHHVEPYQKEPVIDLTKIESVDSDKPFANLKANSVGTAPKKTIKKTIKKKSSIKKIITANTSTALGAPKKRTTRKKDTNV